MNLPPTSEEEEALLTELARHDLRRDVDRAAGLYNDLLTNGSRWREFLESSHQEIFSRWPEIHDALIDARRWENPVHFSGTFAEKVARAKPLPALTTVGQLERLVMRALVMLTMEQPERERLIKEAFDAEKAAMKASEATKLLGLDDVDLSKVKF